MNDVMTMTKEDVNHAWYRARKSMTWFGPGERPCRYRGELVELGFAVPRNVPEFGFRSAVWHFCFGYVSGFPVLHVLYFVATRCLVPALKRRIVSANRRRNEAGAQPREKVYMNGRVTVVA